MAVIRGLYYNYIIASQFYLVIRSNGIDAFNKLDAVAELDTAVESVNATIVVEYYTGSTAFCITNYRQQLFYNGSYTKYKIFFSAFLPEHFI